jgi:RND family efflux transporter MFP subunit
MKIPKIDWHQFHMYVKKAKAAYGYTKEQALSLYSQYKVLDKRYQKAILALIAILIFEFCFRIYAYVDAKFHSEKTSRIAVTVVTPNLNGADSALSFPGRLEAYLNAPIYSRVNGYLQKWNFDIGAEVKKGEVLGQIEAPEIDQQLQQAKSDLVSAKSAEALAKISYQRWKNLLEVDAVSKQEYDQKFTDYEAKKSLRQIAEANLEKAKTFYGYKSIPAPFAGLITERNTDVGALVTAGSGKPLFNVSNIEKLRVFLNIPQVFKNDVLPGLAAKIKVPEFPEKIFEAKVVRSSGAVNENSGTILVEIELDNSEHALTAGEYAQVNVDLPSNKSLPRVPASALIIRKTGVYLASVDSKNEADFIKVEIGRDFGQEVEIIGPINSETKVINNPPDSLIAHEVVQVIAPSPPAKKEI